MLIINVCPVCLVALTTMYLHTYYSVLIVFVLYCKTLLLLLRWNTGKVRDMFGGLRVG